MRLCLPSHAIFCGPTQSGKTSLCLHLLRNAATLFSPSPARVLFHYDLWQESYAAAQAQLAEQGISLAFFKGWDSLSLESLAQRLSSPTTAASAAGQTILIIDDFSEQTAKSMEIARIATNGRHLGVSLWLVWHSLFSHYPASRIISANCRYFFFLPSLRIQSQLRIFGSQLGMKSQLLSAFQLCCCCCSGSGDSHQPQDNTVSTSSSSSRTPPYLLLDAGAHTPALLRLRSNITLPVQNCFA